jgi:hypothetical protein
MMRFSLQEHCSSEASACQSTVLALTGPMKANPKRSAKGPGKLVCVVFIHFGTSFVKAERVLVFCFLHDSRLFGGKPALEALELPVRRRVHWTHRVADMSRMAHRQALAHPNRVCASLAFPKTARAPDRRPRRHGPDGRGPSHGKPLPEIRCARAGPYSKPSHSEPLSNQTQSNQSIPIKPDSAAGGQSRLRTCASCAARGHEFVGRVRLRRTLIGWKLTARQRQNNTRDGPHFAVCLALPYKGFRLR